ncbi:hypothetical protein Zmor_004833 [Zophobas morio]|uniref:Macro domain-containing protein n=1 Tax=Zophobas morio TaxID=2755281 RepID=A0AA38MLQ6_9CUCU|nr:hypothetical protein Zmor_004833 [Zophobas morio]
MGIDGVSTTDKVASVHLAKKIKLDRGVMGGKSKKRSKGKATVDGGNSKGQARDDAIVENAAKAKHPPRNRSPGDVSIQKEVKDNHGFTKSDTWKDNTRSENRRENKNGGFYKPRQSEPSRGNREYEGERRTDTKRYSLNENDRGRGKPRDHSNNRKKYRPNFHQDIEFLQYEDEFLSHKGHIGEYTKVREVFSDLFDAPEDYSLAHCVAEDMNMGSGIAVQFRHKFKRVDDLLNQYQSKGGLAILTDKDRYIYYLVTKTYSTGKPTYATLFSSLKCLKKHVVEKRVQKIAMPRIGCGLDRLDWPNVKFMVEFVFRDVDVEIVVCNLEPTEEASPQQRHRNCRVTHETYAIETIDTGTVILYFSSEDEHISDEMRKLDEKFHFLSDFRYAKKAKGNVILNTRNQNYLICGCIVKKTERDPFDFIALQKCLSAIQKENRKSKFYYYAFQAMRDETDSCINYKIINILRNSLREVEVYVCWPGDLQNEMVPRDRFVDDKSDEKWKPRRRVLP